MNTTTIINVSGGDAKDFLQGQLSNDLNRLDQDSELLTAWCTPKGRVISAFTVTGDTTNYRLRVPSDLAAEIVNRLMMFRFRAKVEFNAEDACVPHDTAAAIEAGIPWIGREQTEKFTPHMLNLDLLYAISLDKGCYTGQEIVARTHYRGATKRRTLRFASNEPVSVGEKVSLDGRDIGEVLNVAGKQLLAVVPVEKAAQRVICDGVELRLLDLPYLN